MVAAGPVALAAPVGSLPGSQPQPVPQPQPSPQPSTGVQPLQRTLVCQPADNGVNPPPSAQAPTVSGTRAAGSDGYLIRVFQPADTSSAMSALLSFQTPQPGRGELAGYADVSRVENSDSTVALEVKSTDQSPFRFDLVVSTQKDAGGSRGGSTEISWRGSLRRGRSDERRVSSAGFHATD